jgi:uncharacterized protein (DUF169 family)
MNMPRLRKQAATIVETLKLEAMPIGVKFSKNPKLKENQPRIKICEAIAFTSQQNLMTTVSRKNCTCSGGRHFMGFEILPVENLAPSLAHKNHRIYQSEKTAVASVKKQPQPVYRGDFVILGPLDKFEKNPDIVLFRANPEQADRLLGLMSYKGAEPFMYYPASSICSIIANALAKGKPDLNLISAFERQRGKWSENELLIALPFKNFVTAIKSIPYSGFGKPQAS